MPRGRPKKEAFADLNPEWKAAVESMSSEDVKKAVATVALNLDELMQAKAADEDLAAKTEAAKEAGAVYREGTKAAKLKIRYAQQLLAARGQ